MIPFADLRRQHDRLKGELEPVFASVLASGEFVLGSHVAEFEEAFASYCGASFGIGVNSGTSALHLALLAAGVGPGDEVIAPAFTFMATVAAIAYTGARPVLVDIAADTFTLDPVQLEAAISARTRAIIPVHLYGHPADMDPILEIAGRRGLAVIEDAAQAHGTEYKGRRVGALADAGCFSFYPGKNLGACGEGGMVLTSRKDWAHALREMRTWGEPPVGHPLSPGYNYRMDALQGAVLNVKLRHLEAWNGARRAFADRFRTSIDGPGLRAPLEQPWARHTYHIFAVRSSNRDRTIESLRKMGVEARVHYPAAIHQMSRFNELGYREGDFPCAEAAAREVISIPVHPELDPLEVDALADALRTISIDAMQEHLAVTKL